MDNQEVCEVIEQEDKLLETISNIPGNTFQKKLDYLAYCNCCIRHQILKPTKYKPWIETQFHNTQYTNLLCSCDCRHLARTICRL